jgi:hypothetical protein
MQRCGLQTSTVSALVLSSVIGCAWRANSIGAWSDGSVVAAIVAVRRSIEKHACGAKQTSIV